MRFGIYVPQFGPYGDPRLLAQLARETEDAGWDGFFLWDHINVGWPDPVADPWIALAAIASTTRRIRLGPLVTPLFRRHPWKVARETATLDHLSNGRLVLGVGLGGDWFREISSFGGPLDDSVRAAMLDESLAIVSGLWSGEKFSFDGVHYKVRDAQFLPPPMQKPRIPIWVAGTWPKKKPFMRAARYEGSVPMTADIEKPLTASDIRAVAQFVERHRQSDAPFEIVASGQMPDDRGEAREYAARYAEAGATWIMEATLPWKQSLDDFRRRIQSGPPA